jgi:AcrR family transcriptional regulator
MGRKRTIDRDAILDAAEAVVVEKGAGQLSFEEVARRAGVSKGGVLYAFPGKQALVAAMAERDMARFERDVARHEAALPVSAQRPVLAHVSATQEESPVLAAKAASLLAALADARDHAGPIREHYANQLRRFGGASPEGRRARLAFMAAEGAFMLRGLGLASLDEDEWAALFADMAELATDGRIG